MTGSTFDPNTFLDGSVEGQFETNYTPYPPKEYTGMIKSVAAREAAGQTVLDIIWIILDEKLKADMNMDECQVRQGIFLDIEPSGALAFGANKNVDLGRLRAAVGQDDPRKPWAPRMLIGAGPATINVINKPDKNDPAKLYNNVKGVTKYKAAA